MTPDRPEWALIKEKDGVFTLCGVLTRGNYEYSTYENELSAMAHKDEDRMNATYHMAFIEDSWTYDEDEN